MAGIAGSTTGTTATWTYTTSTLAAGTHTVEAGVVGHAVFLGLNVGAEGVAFRCLTVNVHNEEDEAFLGFLESDAFLGRAGVGDRGATSTRATVTNGPGADQGRGLSLSSYVLASSKLSRGCGRRLSPIDPYLRRRAAAALPSDA